MPRIVVVAILVPGPCSPTFGWRAAAPARGLDAAGAAFVALAAFLFVRRLAGDDLILRVVNLIILAKPEVLDKASAAADAVAAAVIDRQVDELAACLGRGAAERRLGRDLARPYRLDDRFENRQRHARSR